MKKKVKEAVVFKDRVDNVDAFFSKRTIEHDPKWGRVEKRGDVKAEVEALLNGEKWTTIKGYQQIFDKVDDGKVIMFRKFDKDFYTFGDKLNKTMKDGEKLWVCLGGYGGKEIDHEKTDMYEMPTDADYETMRPSYYNWVVMPYDCLKSHPDTWKKVHDAWENWLQKTPLEVKKEYLDDKWIG